MSKVALITGVTGQDGSYLAEFLLEKGYEVHGIKRRASSFNTERVDHIYQDPHTCNPKFHLHYGDLSDTSNLTRILREVQPDEVYNLGAMSHVAVSLSHQNIPQTLMRWVRCACWRRSASSVWKRKPVSIRLPPLNCTVWCRKFRRKKPRRSTRDLRMRSPNCTPTGSPLTTANPMACTPVTVFSSTMNPAPRRNLRYPKNHPRNRQHRPGAGVVSVPRQYGFPA